MFWTRWRSSVNGAMPIHCAPSPPICVMPVISPLPSGLSSTIVWQPMPAPTSVPSGALVELLCGQPEQKKGERAAIGSGRGRRGDLVERARGRRPPRAARPGRAGGPPRRGPPTSASRSSVAGRSGCAALVALADDAGRVRHAVEGLLERASPRTGPSPRPRGSRRARGRSRAPRPGSSGQIIPSLRIRTPARSSSRSSRPRPAERVAAGRSGPCRRSRCRARRPARPRSRFTSFSRA